MESNAGDRDKRSQLEALIARHEKRIRRFIQERAGPLVLQQTALEDLYQETVSEALGGANTFEFRDEKAFSAWIFTIARRVIARTVSRRTGLGTTRIKLADSTGVGVPEYTLRSPVSTPSSVAAGREHTLALQDAIHRLPPHYRQALELYKLQEMSLREVAAEIGKTKEATAKLLARAMAELRHEMRRRHGFPPGTGAAPGGD